MKTVLKCKWGAFNCVCKTSFTIKFGPSYREAPVFNITFGFISGLLIPVEAKKLDTFTCLETQYDISQWLYENFTICLTYLVISEKFVSIVILTSINIQGMDRLTRLLLSHPEKFLNMFFMFYLKTVSDRASLNN